jgi:hypothetical protein
MLQTKHDSSVYTVYVGSDAAFPLWYRTVLATALVKRLVFQQKYKNTVYQAILWHKWGKSYKLRNIY